MKFTDHELERQRHANEIHELIRTNEYLLQQIEILKLNLRDQFAAAALQGLVEGYSLQDLSASSVSGIVTACYRLANAMSIEREKG